MIHLATATFFVLVLLAALVACHLTIRFAWNDIVAALLGEHGNAFSPAPRRAPGVVRPHAVS